MKKVILALAIVSVTFAACNNGTETETPVVDSPKVEIPVPAPVVVDSPAVKVDSPAVAK